MNNDEDWEVAKDDEQKPEENWNPKEKLAKIKQNILARKKSGAMSHEDASRNYLAYKLLLEHPKMNKETFDKHIDSVIEDLTHPSGKIIDNSHLLFTPDKLRLNKNNIKSDFLKNYFNTIAEQKISKKLYTPVVNASKSGYIDKFYPPIYAKLLQNIKQYYKLGGKSTKQKVSDIIEHAKQDKNHPLSSIHNGHEIFTDLINTLKAGKSQTKSGKKGISFRNKYKS